MKKIFVVFITVFLIIAIYLIHLDKKVFFVSIGDELTLGKTDTGYAKKNYNSHVVDYLSKEKRLEKYVNVYMSEDLRINDMINDINNNKKILDGNKKYTMKNILIKADLVIISINNSDFYNKLNSGYNNDELYIWIDELSDDYETLLTLLRQYCKEQIIVIGPIGFNNEQNKENILLYLNNSFKKISNLYDIEYINTSQILDKQDNFIGRYYPTELGYNKIGEEIILKISR